jgi:hypothetical protein
MNKIIQYEDLTAFRVDTLLSLFDCGPQFNGLRKRWEWAMIALNVDDVKGKRGLGFAVGRESLPAYFASCGAKILATDQLPDERAQRFWGDTGQLATRALDLYSDICPIDIFNENVSFAHCDIREPLTRYYGLFDFVWSAGSLEHLGSLEAGISFVLESLKCLKPGGIAVHTTEYTFGDETVESGDNVFYRRSDLERMREQVLALGYEMDPIDFTRGKHDKNYEVDVHPYPNSDSHLVLEACGVITTSVVFAIRRRV